MDLLSLPIEIDKNKVDGYYRLVVAAVMRAKDLSRGAMPAIDTKAQKVTIRALEEVLSDSVIILSGEKAIKANEEAQKLQQQRMIDEAKQKEGLTEEMTELEKDLKVYLTEKGERDSKKTIEAIFGEE
jgi:DNA-directed RNA polymerase subunit omega